MPERSSTAVTMTVASSPSCTCGGENSIEINRGGCESEFGSFDVSASFERCELLCDDCDCETDDCGWGLLAAGFGAALAAGGFDADDGVRAFTIGASTREIADGRGCGWGAGTVVRGGAVAFGAGPKERASAGCPFG